MTYEELQKLNDLIQTKLAEREKERERKGKIKFLGNLIYDLETRLEKLSKYRGHNHNPDLFYELERAIKEDNQPFKDIDEFDARDFIVELRNAWNNHFYNVKKRLIELTDEFKKILSQEE